MTGNPYAMPVEELVASARVPVSEQVEEQTEPRLAGTDWSPSLYPWSEGMSDADGG